MHVTGKVGLNVTDEKCEDLCRTCGGIPTGLENIRKIPEACGRIVTGDTASFLKSR